MNYDGQRRYDQRRHSHSQQVGIEITIVLWYNI